MRTLTLHILLAILVVACAARLGAAEQWRINSTEEWKQSRSQSEGMKFEDGVASLVGSTGSYRSIVQYFDKKTSAQNSLSSSLRCGLTGSL